MSTWTHQQMTKTLDICSPLLQHDLENSLEMLNLSAKQLKTAISEKDITQKLLRSREQWMDP